MWRHGWPRQCARVAMRALRGCRHGLATRGDADRGPLSRLRRQRRAGERAVPRLSGSRAAPGAGDGTGGHPRGRGLGRPDSRGGPRSCGTMGWATWRPHRHRPRARGSRVHAQGRQPPRGGAHHGRRGGIGCAGACPDPRGHGGAGGAARHAERPGPEIARPRAAPAHGTGTGRSLRHRPRRDSPRHRRADPGALPRAGAAPAAPGSAVMTDKGKPLYMIGVVADMLKVHPQTLRMYEKKGLIRPSRSEGRTRMYSADDVDEVARVIRLARDLGVNLAGIEIILKMRRRMLDMQTQIEDLTRYVQSEMGEIRDPAARGRSEALVRAASTQLKPVDVF